MNSIQFFLKESKSQQDKQNEDFNKLIEQFSQFKEKNNLDEYFFKFLNAKTRQHTLESIDQLMKKEDDWVDQMQDYFNEVNKYQYSDTGINLLSLSLDMQAVKERIEIYNEQNEEAEK